MTLQLSVSVVAVFLCSCGAMAVDEGPLSLSQTKMAVFPEESCSRVGGWCVDRGECPAGKLAEPEGSCPLQERRGVQCCYGVPQTDSSCEGQGGFCTNYCDQKIQLRDADCGPNSVCCALVN